MCGRLNVSLYGTRDAAQNWETEYSATLMEAGYHPGRASPCVFYNKVTGGRIVVHGDDFTVLAPESEIRRVCDIFGSKYEMKLRGIVGPDASDTKEITVLNRVIRWTSKGLEYEPDPRHAELLIEQLALHGCKSLSTPGVKGI